MRELVQCFIAWLTEEPVASNAWRILDALAQETLKRADSPNAEQREFDVAELAEICRPGEYLDYEDTKKWFTRAKPQQFLQVRKKYIQEYFLKQGHSYFLMLECRASTGRHKTMWYLKPYVIENSKELEVVTASDESHQIEYSVTAPGEIKLSWFGKIIMGSGAFKSRSWRGGLWALGLVTSVIALISCGLLIFQMQKVNRPLQTNDLAVFFLLTFLILVIWRHQIRPLLWLVEDRVGFASDTLIKLSEDPAHLDLVKDGDHRYFRLVRYSAVCPICAAAIELRFGQGSQHRRIFGCCTEVPQEHVFTFDRVTKVGQRYIR